MTQKQKDAIKIIANAIHSDNLSIEDAIILLEAMMEGGMVYYNTYPTQPQPLEPYYDCGKVTCNTDEE